MSFNPEHAGMRGRFVNRPDSRTYSYRLRLDPLPVFTNEQVAADEQLERHCKHLASFTDLEA